MSQAKMAPVGRTPPSLCTHSLSAPDARLRLLRHRGMAGITGGTAEHASSFSPPLNRKARRERLRLFPGLPLRITGRVRSFYPLRQPPRITLLTEMGCVEKIDDVERIFAPELLNSVVELTIRAVRCFGAPASYQLCGVRVRDADGWWMEVVTRRIMDSGRCDAVGDKKAPMHSLPKELRSPVLKALRCLLRASVVIIRADTREVLLLRTRNTECGIDLGYRLQFRFWTQKPERRWSAEELLDGLPLAAFSNDEVCQLSRIAHGLEPLIAFAGIWRFSRSDWDAMGEGFDLMAEAWPRAQAVHRKIRSDPKFLEVQQIFHKEAVRRGAGKPLGKGENDIDDFDGLFDLPGGKTHAKFLPSSVSALEKDSVSGRVLFEDVLEGAMREAREECLDYREICFKVPAKSCGDVAAAADDEDAIPHDDPVPHHRKKKRRVSALHIDCEDASGRYFQRLFPCLVDASLVEAGENLGLPFLGFCRKQEYSASSSPLSGFAEPMSGRSSQCGGDGRAGGTWVLAEEVALGRRLERFVREGLVALPRKVAELVERALAEPSRCHALTPRRTVSSSHSSCHKRAIFRLRKLGYSAQEAHAALEAAAGDERFAAALLSGRD